MMTKKVCLVHFQPLEKYPPVMNFITHFESELDDKLFIFSTNGSFKKDATFCAHKALIFRCGQSYNSQGSINRIVNAARYYLFTFFHLLRLKPDAIIYYETLSVFPAYFYSLLFPSVKLAIHHHEFVSKEEIGRTSFFFKILHRLEQQIYRKAGWISQTNSDRIRLFRELNSALDPAKLFVLPNYPPSYWYSSNEICWHSHPVRFVYVGALSLETMYAKEFAFWVHGQKGKVTWDIYSNNYPDSTLRFFKELNSPFIKFREAVQYFKLPEVLPNYNIGIVFYNGHIPNYVYNVPNKVYEYYACGLDVWFSNDLLGCMDLITKNTKPRIVCVDYNQLDRIGLTSMFDRSCLEHRVDKKTAADSFYPLISYLADM